MRNRIHKAFLATVLATAMIVAPITSSAFEVQVVVINHGGGPAPTSIYNLIDIRFVPIPGYPGIYAWFEGFRFDLWMPR